MEKALRDKKRYKLIWLSSLGLAVIAFALAAVFVVNSLYYAMAIFAVISAVCFYLFVFFVFAYCDMKEVIRIIPIVRELGEEDIRGIAQGMGWRRIVTRKFIAKYKKMGYIS